MKFISQIIAEERGATAIEYGLIATLIALSAMSAMLSLGNQVHDQFEHVESKVDEANSAN